MKQNVVNRLLPGCLLLVLMSSCFLLKKTETTPTTTTKTEEPAPKQQEPEKKVEKESPPPPFHVKAFAEKVFKPVYNVALFTPLYIDQITSDTGFSVNNTVPLPASGVGGLEFYEGALLAMDTLQSQGIPLRLYVYDTKSPYRSIKNILSSPQMDSTDLIIGSVNSNELKEISNYAEKKQINFISATYPNDAGIHKNPFLTILNSTLQIHCTGLQNFAQKKFFNRNIIIVYQNNAQEKQVLEYYQQANKKMDFPQKSPLIPFEWTNSTTINDLLPHLDKNKSNVIIITSLYPEVSLNIIAQLIPLTKDYSINVIGMPTLDGNADIKKSNYNGITVYYSTPYPYVNAVNNPAIKSMMWQFFEKYHSRPSDIALKGFETLYYYGHLLKKNGLYFNSNMNDPGGTILTQFNLQPVYERKDSASEVPDYFENKNLYFMQVRDGKVTEAR